MTNVQTNYSAEVKRAYERDGYQDAVADIRRTAGRMQHIADDETLTVIAPANGTYAIAVVHDENSNNKMDLAIFLPKEGFGFSRNPTITVGAPSFKSASFAVTGDTAQSIKMKYML